MEMNIALDTSGYIDFCRGNSSCVNAIQKADRLFLPFVVLAELRSGFILSTQHQNERQFTKFLSSERVEVLFADENTTHHYARLFMQLRRQGTPIPTNDIWIASIVVQHDLTLLATDKHFDSLPQLLRA